MEDGRSVIAASPRPHWSGLRRELARKAFHLGSVGVPVLAWLLPRQVTIGVLLLAAAIAVTVEVARRRVRAARYQFLRRTRPMLRGHERHRVTGATYMAAAYALAAILFPLPVAAAAMLYNALGDAAAALVGKRFGRARTSWGKSWEGFFAGLAINLGVGLLIPGISVAGAIVGALTASTLEFLPLPLDDNLRVTLGGGAGIHVGSLLG
jgi:dolichol kinase